MSSTTAELEAKLRQRMQKCEGSNAMSPKRGHRVWSDEMAKTVSQQRRARFSASKGQGDAAGGNPQDIDGVDALPRSISSSSASSRPPRTKGQRRSPAEGWTEPEPRARSPGKFAFLAGILVVALLLIWGLSQTEKDERGQDGWRSPESRPDIPPTQIPQEEALGSIEPAPETIEPARATSFEGPTAGDGAEPVHDDHDSDHLDSQPGDVSEDGGPAEEGLAGAEESTPYDVANVEEADSDFRAMVKEAGVASHGPFVSIDTRRSGDVSDDWQAFLDQHPAMEQVYSMGRVTFSKRASRISSVTFNATITNVGSTPWSSAALRTVHGSDMGVASLPLHGVIEPGAHCKVSLRLRLPHEDVIPTSMWALSIDDRVFGPLLLLELELEEDVTLSSLLEAQQSTQKPHGASARIFEAPRLLWSDQALREDPAKVGDVSEDWATDLAKTGMEQAYRLGSIVVKESSPKRMASFELLVRLTNTGQSDWPEGTSLRLVSGRSLGCEDLPAPPVSPGSSADISLRLQVPTQEAPEEMAQDSVWVLGDGEQFFGPLLILELSHLSSGTAL